MQIGRIVTIGFFDGVHIGHRYVLDCLYDEAQKRHLEPYVLTFRQPPREVLDATFRPQLLMTCEERLAQIRRYAPLGNRFGCIGERVWVIDFREVYRMTAEVFMTGLQQWGRVQAIVMGYDHRFGSDNLPDLQAYEAIGAKMGISIVPIPQYAPATDPALRVSSTTIRALLQAGEIERANQYLCTLYRIEGEVVHGKGIGRQIGFPTANIQPDTAEKCIPKEGVYAGYLEQEPTNGQAHRQPAIINIGHNPTVGNATQTIEVHIPHWTGDLYGQRVAILLKKRLREERKFQDINALREQIAQDIIHIKGV